MHTITTFIREMFLRLIIIITMIVGKATLRGDAHILGNYTPFTPQMDPHVEAPHRNMGTKKTESIGHLIMSSWFIMVHQVAGGGSVIVHPWKHAICQVWGGGGGRWPTIF